jgi:glycosyltransferase involved in cell wall biosynthesis/SAM-dependent methyltransferase
MKILHVIPHLGGGVGTAFTGITKPNARFPVEHEFILLETPEKTGFAERIRANGTAIFIKPNTGEIEKRIEKTDIVQINWWHHPQMAKFLYDFPDIPMRTICCTHVSGCTYPYLRTDFLKKFNKTLFTSPCSYENPEIATWTFDEKEKKTSVIYDLGDASRFFNLTRKKHDGFRIGYMGTLAFSKLHPEFVGYCAAAASIAEDVMFILIGDQSNTETLLRQAEEYGIANRFEFLGFREDIGEELSQLDCMGYLLNPYHFGTTENAILETMAAGVPIVLMNQNTEKYIVEHEKDGFLVNNQTEYREVIRHLYHDASERERVARNAKIRIKTDFDVDQNNRKLWCCYEEVMTYPKQRVTFRDIIGRQPSDWFLHFIGHEKILFLENRFENIGEIFKGESKSSVRHFAKYFPEDERLASWNMKIQEQNDIKRNNKIPGKTRFRRCPVCDNDKTEILYHQKRVHLSDAIFPDESDIVACQHCGFVYVDSDLTQEKLNRYYGKFSSYEYRGEDSDIALNDSTRERFEVLRKYVSEYCKKDDLIMDIGSARGTFLRILKEHGFTKLSGMDMSEKNLAILKSHGIIPVLGSITTYDCNTFHKTGEPPKVSMIVMSHILEHIHDLHAVFSNIENLLTDNGHLLIEVPDAAAYHEAPGKWFFNEEHINHFDENSLVNIAGKYGFSQQQQQHRIITGDLPKLPVVTIIFSRTNTLLNTVTANFSCAKNVKKYISWLQNMWFRPARIIDELASTKKNVAVWGTGNALFDLIDNTQIEKLNIDYIVDSDKHKHGKTILGKTVTSPDVLRNYAGHILVVSNYFSQSILTAIANMGLTNEVLIVP